MRVVASLPKPVLTPYTGASPSAVRPTSSALARMPARQLDASVTGMRRAPHRRRSCASVSSPGDDGFALHPSIGSFRPFSRAQSRALS